MRIIRPKTRQLTQAEYVRERQRVQEELRARLLAKGAAIKHVQFFKAVENIMRKNGFKDPSINRRRPHV